MTLLLMLVVSAGTAYGQAGVISVAADPGGSSYTIFDTGVDLKTVYVLHTLTPGVIASRFKIEESPNVTMVYVGETVHEPAYVGDTRVGITICYGVCKTSPVLLVSMQYAAFGTSGDCSAIYPVPHPSSTTFEAVDCGGHTLVAGCSGAWVNQTINCQGSPPDCSVDGSVSGVPLSCTVPTEPSTWGQIKSMFD